MKRVRNMLGVIVGAILIVLLLRNGVATSYLIPSSGMEPTLYQGERILVNKCSYGLRLPFMQWWGYHRWGDCQVTQGDVLTFNNPANYKEKVISQREVFIGRCTGTPGDTLWVDSLFNQTSVAKDSLCHPLIVPRKGLTIPVHAWNSTLLRNMLVLHERRQAEVRRDTLFIDGHPATHCTFTKDYFWISTDNPTNLSDSRLFGFVPEDHIIGKAVLVWLSKKEGTGFLRGYRQERIGLPIH